jgi:hypothetical protein
MSIDTVLLILILTFGVGFVLDRLDISRYRPRRGSPGGRVSARRRA